jgi:ABC-type transport system substrate-binding protein
VTMALYNMDNPVVGGYTPEKVALRRAINLGYDTPETIRTYYKFQAFPAQSILMPGEYGYDPQLRTENGLTSVARARALLDEYGYVPRHGTRWRDNPDGSTLVIEFSTQPDQRSRIISEIFKKSLDALNLRSAVRLAQFPDQLKAARAGNYMIWLLGESADTPDPSSTVMMAYGPSAGAENMSRFRLAAYDALYLKQNQIPDGAERIEVLRQMTALLTAYAPFKLVVHRYTIDMAYPWLHYYRRWPFTHSDFWRYVDIDQTLKTRALRH